MPGRHSGPSVAVGPRGLIDKLHDVVRAAGFDVVRFQPSSHPLARRFRLFDVFGIDLVVDVGANDGGYGSELRRLGYRGRIVSFEPLPDAIERLDRRRAGDTSWEARDVALGDVDGEATIQIAGNSASSSLLPMLAAHERYEPRSRPVGRLTVQVRRLDDIAGDVLKDSRRPLLKLDTQGYEGRVLDGAERTLGRCSGVQVELSLVPLYEGAPLAHEMVDRLTAAGFQLMGIEPGFSDPASGQLLQFDGVFFRPEMKQPS